MNNRKVDNCINDFVAYCKKTFDLSFSQNSTGYKSMSICIIDCVYSLRAKYDSVTVPVIDRYVKKYMQDDKYRAGDDVSDLIDHIIQARGAESFAHNILMNNQKSGGVLKSEICYKLAYFLKLLGIETVEDFRTYESTELLDIVVRSVKGIGDAGANYFFMLTGDSNRCKPDVHIRQCVKDACDITLSESEYQDLFKSAVKVLRKDYPSLTVSCLDYIIWAYYQKGLNSY